MSLPAHGIEKLVIDELAAFLNNQSTIAGLFQNDNASDLETMLAVAHTTAGQLKSNPKRVALKSLLNKVVVTPDQLDIHVNLHGLREMICNNGHEGSDVDTVSNEDGHIITHRIQLKRSSHGKRIILDRGKNNEQGKVDPSLLKAIARAHIWFDDLKAGCSYKDIAARENIDQRHVARTIRLAFLAPDITESIFNGNAPKTLTVDYLLRLPELPVEWQDQRELLQFV